MEQHSGGPVSPTDPIDCEGPTSPRPMLEEEAEKMMEEKRKARRLSAATAVTVEWQRWQALETEARRAGAITFSSDRGDDATLARVRVAMSRGRAAPPR